MEGKFVGFEECDTFKDLLASLNSRANIDDDWMVDKCNSAPEHLKGWLHPLLTKAMRCVHPHTDHDNDGYTSTQDDNDPQYTSFLASLKECGNAYVLHDQDDSLLFSKYEQEEEEDYVSSGGECDRQPRRKLRSASAKENGWTTGANTPVENTDNMTETRRRRRKNSMEQPKNNKAGGNPRAQEEKPDTDYYNFIQACKIVDDCVNYHYQDRVIVYGKDDDKVELHDDTDGSSSDVEILDSDPFIHKVNLKPYELNTDCHMNSEVSPMRADFRQEVIAILKSPYDSEEYRKLSDDINFRKPQLHHRELRSGRLTSTPTDTLAKSYLQLYPDLEERLKSSHHNEPECLNLLRGFFFWLEKISHPGAFKPWLDRDCLSVYPGSS